MNARQTGTWIIRNKNTIKDGLIISIGTTTFIMLITFLTYMKVYIDRTNNNTEYIKDAKKEREKLQCFVEKEDKELQRQIYVLDSREQHLFFKIKLDISQFPLNPSRRAPFNN